MGNLKRTFGTNEDKENKGIWFKVYTNDGNECEFLITSTSAVNIKYIKHVDKLQKKYRTLKTIPTELLVSLTKKAYLDVCLLDWKNVSLSDDGTLLPYSRENAETLFKEVPALAQTLMEASADIANFQDEDWEDTVKNS